MEIIKIGHHHSHNDTFQICRERGSGDYLLLLVFTPSRMILNGEEVIMNAPFFILYREGTMQQYGAYQGKYLDDWIHLSFNRQDLMLMDELGIPMDEPVALQDIEELSDLIRQIAYEFHAARSFRQDTLRLYLRILFNRIGEHFRAPSQSPHFSALNRIRGRMYNEPFREYSIDAMSHEAGMSRSSFQHIYRDIFGISATADLIRARIAYARELLLATTAPVSQIAEMCGYHSSIHFMRQFKAQTGMTPSQYRKS